MLRDRMARVGARQPEEILVEPEHGRAAAGPLAEQVFLALG
jgi:hypothetical protein